MARRLAAWHEAGHVVAFHMAGIRVLGATSGVPEGAPVGVRGCTWTEDFGGFSRFVQPSGEGHLIDQAGFREWLSGQDLDLVHGRIRATIFGLLGGGVAVAQMRTVEGVACDIRGDGMDTLAAVAFASLLPEPEEIVAIWSRLEKDLTSDNNWKTVETVCAELLAAEDVEAARLKELLQWVDAGNIAP